MVDIAATFCDRAAARKIEARGQLLSTAVEAGVVSITQRTTELLHKLCEHTLGRKAANLPPAPHDEQQAGEDLLPIAQQDRRMWPPAVMMV